LETIRFVIKFVSAKSGIWWSKFRLILQVEAWLRRDYGSVLSSCTTKVWFLQAAAEALWPRRYPGWRYTFAIDLTLNESRIFIWSEHCTMVIGKSKPTKSQSQYSKRVSGSGSSMNASAPSPGLTSAKSSFKTSHSVSAPSCGSCGSVITDDTKALQCDRCVAPDIWKCANCLHLSDEMYDQLVCLRLHT